VFSLVLQLQREKRWAFEEEDEEDDDDNNEFFFYVSRYSSRGVVGVVGVLRER
jgi:hypothetical protein